MGNWHLADCAKRLSRHDWIIGLVLTLYLVVAFASVPDYGLTPDEPAHYRPESYLKFFRDWDTSIWSAHVHRHPPVAEFLSLFTWHVFHNVLGLLDPLSAHRVPIVILGVVTVSAVYALASKAYDQYAATIAALSLMFFPRFFAHLHYNIKDIPLTGLYTLAIWIFWRHIGDKDWKKLILSGILLGLALGVRITAAFLPIVLFSWLLIGFRDKMGYRSIKRGVIPAQLRAFPLYLLIGVLTFMWVWPWLWSERLTRLMEFVSWCRHGAIGHSVFYLGRFWRTGIDLPWHYPYVMLAITTPLPVLIFAIVGAALAVKDTWTLKNRTSSLILIWLAVALLKENIPGANVEDGIRYFMEAVPALCLLAGIGATSIYRLGREKLKFDRKGFLNRGHVLAVLILLSLFSGLLAILRMHPYEGCYYNALVGGVSGASENFEMGYWGVFYKEAVEWLNRHAEKDAVIGVVEWSVLAEYYARPDLGIIGTDPTRVGVEGLDYVILCGDSVVFWGDSIRIDPRRWGGAPLFFQELLNLEPIYTVRVDETPLLHIYELGACESRST